MRRLAERTDLSSQLVHLTREQEGKSVNEMLYEIISSGELQGSTTKSGFVCGKKIAVCFQDAPLISVCQNVFYEQKKIELDKSEKLRYRAVGIAVYKHYAYKKGARPVFYEETEMAKSILPMDQWWRIVNLNLHNESSIIDWTHEREWRLPGNFEFDISEVTLIFVSSQSFKTFLKLCKKNSKNYIHEVKGVVVMDNLLY